jgi:hypothetical protein
LQPTQAIQQSQLQQRVLSAPIRTLNVTRYPICSGGQTNVPSRGQLPPVVDIFAPVWPW